MPETAEALDPDEVTSVEDEKFDRIYSAQIRELSSVFWTPLAIAAETAKLLVTTTGTHVLDIGCGPGKFCLVAASLAEGRFTGIEQRGDLVATAVTAAAELSLSRVHFLHANVMEIAFADYDAFYLFNPFEENMFGGHKIDSSVPLSPELFKRYTSHVATELAARPVGTRVVTYMGYADEIPACYSCELALFRDDLKLWVKNRQPDLALEHLTLRATRSYRGSIGRSSPRNSA